MTLPYGARNLCTIGDRSTSGKHKATIGILYFILEENGHLVNKKTDKPVRKTLGNNLMNIFNDKELTLICMS